jgi:EAL domain-containing protein (putative c-di-GMP-specific phosphodiesterase class I)
MGAQAVRLSNVDIDNALKNRDFEVLFQPIFDLGNGALARVETFVRWRHPSLGLLPPGAFISFFENQGRMSELTRYVLDQALTEYRNWRGASAPGFSINLALTDLSDGAFPSHFEVYLRDRGFPADLITLECPMPPANMPFEAAAEHFKRLRQTGARLAIEVRGRANDFLRGIDPFPFDEIKTGGAAILRFARTVRGPGLSAISELLEIAQRANAAITAVGVEDQASLSALRGLGFAAAQGNHLGKVGPLSAFTPSRVNEVRDLLGLEPLSSQDLNALFRTTSPAPVVEAPAAASAMVEAIEDRTLVERLGARIGKTAQSEPAIAQRVPERAALKAAAIARARQRRAQARAAAAEAPAARELQERLQREFEAAAFAPDSAFASAEEVSDLQTGVGPVTDDTAAEAAQRELMTDKADNRTSANAEASAQPERRADAASESVFTARLAVAGARAFFRPGFRVAAVRAASEETRAVPLAEPQESAPPAEPAAAAQDVAATPQQTAFASPKIAPEAQPAEAAAEQESSFVEAAAEAAVRPTRRRKENFLTRKYRLWPEHFWPRSWKRAWRRRAAERAARKAERDSETP